MHVYCVIHMLRYASVSSTYIYLFLSLSCTFSNGLELRAACLPSVFIPHSSGKFKIERLGYLWARMSGKSICANVYTCTRRQEYISTHLAYALNFNKIAYGCRFTAKKMRMKRKERKKQCALIMHEHSGCLNMESLQRMQWPERERERERE